MPVGTDEQNACERRVRMKTGYPTLRLLTVTSNPVDVSREQLNCRRVSATIGLIALILGASIAIPIAMLRAADEPWNPPSASPLATDQESGKRLAALIAAIPPHSTPDAKEAPIESQPKTGAEIEPATEQKLEWGEPVNGLRMALAWPPTLGEPTVGEVPDLYLAVQNVSEAPVRLCTTAEATMRRGLLFSTNGVAEMRTLSEAPNGSDATLGPREVVFLRLFVESAKDTEKVPRSDARLRRTSGAAGDIAGGYGNFSSPCSHGQECWSHLKSRAGGCGSSAEPEGGRSCSKCGWVIRG